MKKKAQLRAPSGFRMLDGATYVLDIITQYNEFRNTLFSTLLSKF